MIEYACEECLEDIDHDGNRRVGWVICPECIALNDREDCPRCEADYPKGGDHQCEETP